MRKFWVSVVLLCGGFSMAGVPVAIAGPTADIPTAHILELEQEFNAAYAANELEKYFGFYAEDAILWFQDGRTDLPAYKKMWGEFLQSGAGIKAATTTDMHVKFAPRGDAAVASYVLHLTTREADKKVHSEDYQETDVWFNTAVGWKVMHVHYSDAPKPKKP